MPLDFPNTSTTGTVYTGTNNVVYIYDGVRWNGNGTGSLIPPINLTYDLGSTSSQWLNLYVGNAYVNGQPVGSVTTGTTAPTGGLGKLWYNPDVGRLYIYYDSYWVDASPPVGSSGGSGGTIDLTAVTTDVLPNTNLTYNLGSPSKQWRSLYVGTSTIYIGGTALSISTSGSLTVNGAPVSSFNTATLVTRAVSANTASFATTASYAQSFNTGTLVTAAVSSTNIVNGTWTLALSTAGSILINGTVFSGGSSSATTSTLVNGTWTVSLSTSGTLTFPTNTTFTGLASAGTTSTTAAALGYMGMPQNSTATSYTLVAGDQGKHIYITATGQTITVPSNSTTAFPVGTTIAIIAGPSATSSSIAITTDTMYLGGTGATGTRTLAAYGMATLVKVTTTTWFINGSGLT